MTRLIFAVLVFLAFLGVAYYVSRRRWEPEPEPAMFV